MGKYHPFPSQVDDPEVCSTWPEWFPSGLVYGKNFGYEIVVAVQSLSHVWLFRPHGLQDAMLLHSPLYPGVCSNSCPLSQWCYLTNLILCHPLCLFPSSVFPSIRVFSNESALHIRWPKYWSFSFSISTSNKYSELISFRIDWFDFLTVQGTLKSLLQHHNSKASILQCSAFFMVQLSHLYRTSGKTITLTMWTFVGKVCLGLSYLSF